MKVGPKVVQKAASMVGSLVDCLARLMAARMVE